MAVRLDLFSSFTRVDILVHLLAVLRRIVKRRQDALRRPRPKSSLQPEKIPEKLLVNFSLALSGSLDYQDELIESKCITRVAMRRRRQSKSDIVTSHHIPISNLCSIWKKLVLYQSSI